ncbi:hypothetical protein AAFC00_005639 [Neodothiora populina]|uniref:Uncharacterized protein n=1 Tax=Neodothiora populina TaxID=2781224 RepID=A0ABR3PLV2_9PEZI
MFPYSANTPDSTLPAGVIERDDREEDDPWLGVIKGSNIRGYNGGFHDGLSPQSPLDRPPQAPARMWQDVTRRLSLAPAAYNEHVPGPHMFQTH